MSRSEDKRKIIIRKEDRKVAKKEALAVLKKTSDTNMIVAALIVTVAFAAGFTMPGRWLQPKWLQPKWHYKLSLRNDCFITKTSFSSFYDIRCYSLLLSCVAIFLNFWGTIFDDQRIVQKFVVVTIFLVTAAIGVVMIAFSTATYVVLAQSYALAIATCLVGSVSIPVSFVLFSRLIQL